MSTLQPETDINFSLFFLLSKLKAGNQSSFYAWTIAEKDKEHAEYSGNHASQLTRCNVSNVLRASYNDFFSRRILVDSGLRIGGRNNNYHPLDESRYKFISTEFYFYGSWAKQKDNKVEEIFGMLNASIMNKRRQDRQHRERTELIKSRKYMYTYLQEFIAR